MAVDSEREASQEIEISVAPISGRSSRRQIKVGEDNAAGSGFQSPTFKYSSQVLDGSLCSLRSQ